MSIVERRLRRFTARLCTVAIALGPVVVAAPAQAGDVDHSLLDKILRDNVRDERVDYLTLRQEYWRDLAAYLDAVAEVEVGKLARNEQLAYYINLYNATVIRAVAERFRAGYTVSEDKFALFDQDLVRLKGRTISLNHLEHKIIRAEFRDPRIHAALVCAARSCPPLLSRAYRGEDLEAVLEENMKRFINDSSRNVTDAPEGPLRLSAIFDWYAEDFGGREALAAYVTRYADTRLSGNKVVFLDYSWELNLAEPKHGSWVEVTRDRTPLRSQPDGGNAVREARRGEVLRVIDEGEDAVHVELPFGEGDAWIDAARVRPFQVDNP